MTPRIYLAISSMRGMRPRAFNSLPFRSVDMIKMDSSVFLDQSRNKMVDDFLKTDCDYLYQVDDDIILPPNIMDIFKVQDPIVSPVCFVRYGGAPYPGIYNIAEDKGEYLEPWTWQDVYKRKDPDGYIRGINVISSSYAVRRDVFEKTKDNDGEWYKLLWRDNLDRIRRGEDVYFFKRCMDNGYSISANPDVVCGHLKEMDLKVSFDYLRKMTE